MANNKAFKVKNGIQAGRYLLSNGVETAGSVGYSLANAVYDSKSFSVAGQELTPRGLQFKTDGTKMYIVGNSSDQVRQYTLSTAWDISTASYDSVTLIVSGQDNTPLSLFFKPDGTKFYITGNTNLSVFQYSLSTAWDLSTASYDSVSFSFSANTSFPAGLAFKPDGFKMFITDNTNDQIDEYILSTAWDVSTASYNTNVSVSPNVTSPASFVFNVDGSAFFICDLAVATITEYVLSTSWDISSSTYVRSLDTSSQASSTSSLSFKTEGSKLYIVNAADDTIYQYSTVAYTQTLDLSTGTTFAFTPSGATTVSFTNPPASGLACAFTVEITGDGSAITWPASVKWHEATAPTATATKEVYVFITTDGGTTYYGKKAAGELA